MNVLPKPNWPNENGALFYGWAGELAYPNKIGFDLHVELYCNMVNWIKENISQYSHNIFWNKIGDCIYVQFRKKQDMTWFLLKFGK